MLHLPPAMLLVQACTVSPPTDGYDALPAKSAEGRCSGEGRNRIVELLRETSTTYGLKIAGGEAGTRIVTLSGRQSQISVAFGVFDPRDVIIGEYPAAGANQDHSPAFDIIAAAVRDCEKAR
jgi:hypothetical protein